jgi:hypothetical protein
MKSQSPTPESLVAEGIETKCAAAFRHHHTGVAGDWVVPIGFGRLGFVWMVWPVRECVRDEKNCGQAEADREYLVKPVFHVFPFLLVSWEAAWRGLQVPP